MKRILNIAKTLSLCMATALLVFRPVSVMAEEVAPVPAADNNSSASEATEPVYTYNPETGHWDSDKWYFDNSTGTYKTKVVPPPAESVPTVIDPQSGSNVNNTDNQTNAVDSNQTDLLNAVNSSAFTGNADVARNTDGGDATSGDATAVATVMNTVNSTLTTADNQKAATFVKDVIGDVNGDILLQPILLKAMLEAGAKSPSTNAALNNTTGITNNLDLGAISGNANIVGNTTGGNATSGSANTVANVMNLINSMVASNQSFVGTINIYGNLNGDILIAPDFFSQLIASNAQNNNLEGSSGNTAAINASNTQSIVNNVSLAAESGMATVLDNTKAGNAKTGDANTNLVIFNLSGHEIVAKDSLLVFVNVLGKWVGVILDAPGATAAAVGNGVTSDQSVQPDLKLAIDNNAQITNNINLASRSGDATVMGNTLAGDATSGQATASANIANISNSSLGLSGWFGVLFINVFGSWYGSFGVDTPYGNLAPTNQLAPSGARSGSVIQFIPRDQSSLQPARTPALNLTIISQVDEGSYSVAEVSKATGVLGVSGSSDHGGGSTGVQADTLGAYQNILLAAPVFLGVTSALGIRRFRLHKSLNLLKIRTLLTWI